jgi:hypothetical protein
MHEHQGGQKASKHHGEGSPHAIPMIAKYTLEGVSIGKVWLDEFEQLQTYAKEH